MDPATRALVERSTVKRMNLPRPLLFCLIAFMPRAARAEPPCSGAWSAPPKAECFAARTTSPLLPTLTQNGARVILGGAILQFEIASTRFAIAISLPL